MNMKRQSSGIRRTTEESRQSQISETKRLKVFHEPEIPNPDMEGSGSDTTEECININTNGQNSSEFIQPENTFPSNHSEENNHTHTNGNSSVDFNPNMNISNGESHLPRDIFNDQDQNASPQIITNAFTVDSVDIVAQNILVAEAGEPFQDDRCATPPMPSLVPSQAVAHEVASCTDNVAATPLDVAHPVQVDAEEHSSDENADAAGSQMLNGKFDLENLTMCELKVTRLEGHADVVFSVAADGDFVLSSSGDTTVKVWDVEKNSEVSNFAGHSGAVTSVILLSAEQSESLRTKLNCFETSRIAISASYDCHIRLWSVLDGHEILSMYTFNSITCMGFLENHMYVVVGTEGGKLEVWDLHTAKQVHSVYAHDSSVSHLEVNDCYIYSTSKDGAVKVWLFDEGELQPLYTRRRKEGFTASHLGPTQWQTVSVHNDILYLGDNTCHLKALDWRLGRLQLFFNQPDEQGSCEAVLAKNNILLTSFFNSSTDTGGINVWQLPELTYVGTLTGDLQEICSLAVVQSQNKLRIISGGHQLIVWDFDFSKAAAKTAQDPYFVCEVDKVGLQVNEESVDLANKKHLSASIDNVDSKEKQKSWCNIS